MRKKLSSIFGIAVILCSMFLGADTVYAASGITFDNVSATSGDLGNANPAVFSYTVNAGNNRILVVGYRQVSVVLGITSATYNGVAMTCDTGSIGSSVDSNFICYLLNPATGAHNISIVPSGTPVNQFMYAAQYDGVGSVESDTGGAASATSLTISTTTAQDNEWLIAFFSSGGNISAGTNTTKRSGTDTMGIMDSNADQTPAGSHSLQATDSNSQFVGRMLAVIGAAVASAPPPQGVDTDWWY